MYVYQCDVCGDITPTVVLRNTTEVPLCMHSRDGRKPEGVPMRRVEDNSRERVLLPLDGPTVARASGGQDAMLVPAKVDKLHAAGFLLPETQHALDWMWRHKATNGMASAFLKVGGRRCIDLVEFARLMRSKQA